MTPQTIFSHPDRSHALPLWVRLSVAFLMFLDAALRMAKHFFQFEWVVWLSFGFYFLLVQPRSREESLSRYLSKPRTIVAQIFLLVLVAGFMRDLYLLFGK